MKFPVNKTFGVVVQAKILAIPNVVGITRYASKLLDDPCWA